MRRLAAVAISVLLVGCGGGPSSNTITVFAASSLTEAFETLAADYEAAHGARVVLNFSGSSSLAQQIDQGAEADVFAAADPAVMQGVRPVEGPVTFARNRLQIAVPKGNPARVIGLGDFTRAGLRIAMCDVRVPCGRAAQRAFAAAGLTPRPDTLEPDVKATLAKVRLGDVDAALVYRTDVLSARPNVDGIDFPESAQTVNDYPVLALTDEGREFVAYLRSEPARRVLAGAGFELP